MSGLARINVGAAANGLFGWRTQGASGIAAVYHTPSDATPPTGSLNMDHCAISKAVGDMQSYLINDDGTVPQGATITSVAINIVSCDAGAALDPMGNVNTFDGGLYGGAATFAPLVSGVRAPAMTMLHNTSPARDVVTYTTNPGTGVAWKRDEVFDCTTFGFVLINR